MKRQILFIVLILLGFNNVFSRSEKFRILYINTPSINIGDKELVKGDDFSNTDEIKWSSLEQAMRVSSLETGRQYVVTARRVEKKRGSLLSYLTSQRSLSTRPGKPTTIVGLRNEIADTLQILDRCEFYTTIPIDTKRFFYATYHRNGEIVNKILPSIDGGFAIDRSLWTIDGCANEPHTTTISIYYYDEEKGEVTTVADNVVVIPLKCNVD